MNYCESCGAPLIETQRLSHYQPRDGYAVYRFTRTCPQKRWWNTHTKAHAVAASSEELDRSLQWWWQ